MRINQFRRSVLMKGFANLQETKTFLNVGSKRAKQVFDEIEQELEEKKKKKHPSGVLATRLLSYIGMTDAKVFEYASIEDKEKALHEQDQSK